MGCAASTPDVDHDVVAVSKRIDKLLTQERKQIEAERVIKLLLLGIGEAGKSTILKQMKIIYGSGFSEDDLKIYRSATILSVLTCFKTLIAAMDLLQIPYGFTIPTPDDIKSFQDAFFEDPERDHDFLLGFDISAGDVVQSGMSGLVLPAEDAEPHPKKPDIIARMAANEYRLKSGRKQTSEMAEIARQFIDQENHDLFGVGNDENIPPHKLEMMIKLWNDSGIRYCQSRWKEFHLMECCVYLMENLERICHVAFTPSERDILALRVMTTSITETKFVVEGTICRVFDVGGQRSQRKKWAPLFDDVDAIIYVAAISAYDQVCFEARDVNRMFEALTVFKSIVNHKLFEKTGIILFLNKIDLFREKLKTTLVSDYFPTFRGENSFNDAIEFFTDSFKVLNKNPKRNIYIHQTWATDTNQTKKVLDSVYACITDFNLAQGGL
ncbi:guanine nucleotide binding protein, alpha subunit [Chytriomyces cf. hyalinus JEL632]|nr:guanine nucleotide binding protein, alpha subunit [Chytriomyces cf. hyalinus JEL632]